MRILRLVGLLMILVLQAVLVYQTHQRTKRMREILHNMEVIEQIQKEGKNILDYSTRTL